MSREAFGPHGIGAARSSISLVSRSLLLSPGWFYRASLSPDHPRPPTLGNGREPERGREDFMLCSLAPHDFNLRARALLLPPRSPGSSLARTAFLSYERPEARATPLAARKKGGPKRSSYFLCSDSDLGGPKWPPMI